MKYSFFGSRSFKLITISDCPVPISHFTSLNISRPVFSMIFPMYRTGSFNEPQPSPVFRVKVDVAVLGLYVNHAPTSNPPGLTHLDRTLDHFNDPTTNLSALWGGCFDVITFTPLTRKLSCAPNDMDMYRRIKINVIRIIVLRACRQIYYCRRYRTRLERIF